MKTTVFTSGGSQAVRIPKEFRFDTKRVEIERKGGALILRPVLEDNAWPKGYIEAIREQAVGEDFARPPQGEHRDVSW
ncbi:MAG: AbrB/MazE/SpoVT family DNA-binding domain-containing protein [Verrucomicrobiota bacterium]